MIKKEICTLSRQVFIRFLKEMKIYDKFKKNLFDPNIKIFDGLETNMEEFYICDAFEWENSPEGEDFWGGIDALWNDVVDEFYTYRSNISRNDVTAIKYICKKLYEEFYC